MKDRPHLQQIADLLGVSKMTVSRALREGTSVDPELRAKIRETAARIRYQPDSRISQLMSEIRKTRTSDYRETLAFIWTHPSTKKTKDYFFYEGFEGARTRAESLGYKLDQFHVKEEALTRPGAFTHPACARHSRHPHLAADRSAVLSACVAGLEIVLLRPDRPIDGEYGTGPRAA